MTNRRILKGTTRQMVMRLVVLFGLGIASTIGLAWGIAGAREVRVFDLFYSMYADGQTRLAWRGVEKGEYPYLKYCVIRSPGRLDLHARGMRGREENIAKLYVLEAPPAWSQCKRALLPRDNDQAGIFWLESLAGWPFLALKQIRYWNSPNPFVVEQGWIIEQTHSTAYPFGTVRSLPLQPVWPGFLADITIYAFGWGFVRMLWNASRRWRRMRQGLCPDCTYNLRHEFKGGCPECGWKRSGGANNHADG